MRYLTWVLQCKRGHKACTFEMLAADPPERVISDQEDRLAAAQREADRRAVRFNRLESPERAGSLEDVG